ncbi:MAG: hypothetical protein Q9196_006526 [Gyalolechia fulgens]
MVGRARTISITSIEAFSSYRKLQYKNLVGRARTISITATEAFGSHRKLQTHQLSRIMDINDCKRGFWNPTFHNADEVETIRKAFADDGCVFVDGCGGSLPLLRLSAQLGRIVKPRNEVSAGSGVSNIRCAPDLEGKGYSSEG